MIFCISGPLDIFFFVKIPFLSYFVPIHTLSFKSQLKAVSIKSLWSHFFMISIDFFIVIKQYCIYHAPSAPTVVVLAIAITNIYRVIPVYSCLYWELGDWIVEDWSLSSKLRIYLEALDLHQSKILIIITTKQTILVIKSVMQH